MFSITSLDSSDASNISCDSKAHSQTLCGWSSFANRSYLPLVWAKAAVPFCRLGARRKSQITKHDVAAVQLQAFISALLYFSNQHLLAVCVSFCVYPFNGSTDVTYRCWELSLGHFYYMILKYLMSHFASVQPKSVLGWTEVSMLNVTFGQQDWAQ